MPSVVETPEILREALGQQEVREATSAAASTTPLRPWASRLARLTALLPGSRKRPPQLYWWHEEAPKPLEDPKDRVAREFPQLFLLGHCG
jgi:hypothetical protein